MYIIGNMEVTADRMLPLPLVIAAGSKFYLVIPILVPGKLVVFLEVVISWNGVAGTLETLVVSADICKK